MIEKTPCKIVLIGVHTPLIGDYVDSCTRLGWEISALVKVDDKPARLSDKTNVILLDKLKSEHINTSFVAASFSPKRRRYLLATAWRHGFKKSATLVDGSSVVSTSSVVGMGTYINGMSIVGSSSRIGEYVFINRGCNIGHHVIVGDFASIGPGVTITSGVAIGEGALIGAGATILPGVHIGNGAVIAAATRIHQNVPEHTLAIGTKPELKPIVEGSTVMEYFDQE